MSKPPVLTKKDFVRRYAAGEFGNASPTWNGYLDWYYDCCYEGTHYVKKSREGLYHIRNRVAGAETWYSIPAGAPLGDSNLWQCWYEVATKKYAPSQLYISLMAPTEKTLIQGEVMRGEWGLDLTYTTVAKPMRDALAERTQTARGIIASSILSRFLCPNSLTWLEHLLDEYPDHVVEFSTFSCNWGTVPGYNTVYWECRKY